MRAAVISRVWGRFVNSILKRAVMCFSWCCLYFSFREHTPGMLFVSYSFLSKGGVEKRIHQYAPVWRKRGYKTYIAARRGASLLGLDLLLTPSGHYNDRLLSLFIKKKNIRAVEWQAGGSGLPPFGFAALKKRGVRVGVAVHASRAEWDFGYLREADYIICASALHGRRIAALKDAPILPNALEYRPAVWRFSGQSKAVFISRLAWDKIPAFEAFISACRAWDVPFELAGGLAGEEARCVRRALCAKYALAEEVFIGEVDTYTFLTENVSRYLFVGGVGQVILEAGQLGYPCLVCSVCGPGFAFFAEREKFTRLVDNNCSPRLVHEMALFAADVRHAQEDLQKVRRGKTEGFLLAREINQSCALQPELEKYERIIFGGK